MAVAVATGCAAEPVDGAAAAVTGKAALFDPCTELPPEALQAAGVDPTITDQGIAGVEFSEWNICGWDGGPFGLRVSATQITMEQFRAKERNIDFRDVAVGSRSAVTYRVDDSFRDLECALVFPTKQGTIHVWVLEDYSPHGREMTELPCDTAVRIANILDGHLPNS